MPGIGSSLPAVLVGSDFAYRSVGLLWISLAYTHRFADICHISIHIIHQQFGGHCQAYGFITPAQWWFEELTWRYITNLWHWHRHHFWNTRKYGSESKHLKQASCPTWTKQIRHQPLSRVAALASLSFRASKVTYFGLVIPQFTMYGLCPVLGAAMSMRGNSLRFAMVIQLCLRFHVCYISLSI